MKKPKEKTLCIVHTVKDFLQGRFCGGICVLVNLDQDHNPPNQERTVFSPCARTQRLCIQTYVGKELWAVISAMNPDPVTEIIKNDHVIIDVGQHLLNKGGISAKNQRCVRERMREMGRMILKCQKIHHIKKNMEDFINPNKYLETVRAVKFTCGYDSEKNKFVVPSLANKRGQTCPC